MFYHGLDRGVNHCKKSVRDLEIYKSSQFFGRFIEIYRDLWRFMEIYRDLKRFIEIYRDL